MLSITRKINANCYNATMVYLLLQLLVTDCNIKVASSAVDESVRRLYTCTACKVTEATQVFISVT